MYKLDEEGFTFLDDLSRPFKCQLWENEPWLFRWNKHQKCWTSFRRITSQQEIDKHYESLNQNALRALKEALKEKW